MRLLGPEHFAAVVGVQEALMAGLQNPSIYYPNPPELLRLCLGERGLTIGTFVANRLIGFRSILYPGPREDNLGRDIGLSGDDLDQVAHLERTVVLPDYRGNRLQMRMTAHAIRLGIATREVRHLFSTVAPANIASMADKFKIGMLIVRTKEKYQHYTRHLFYQDLRTPVGIEPNTSRPVDLEDLATQRQLVEVQGWVGHGLSGQGQQIRVLYGQPTRLLNWRHIRGHSSPAAAR
jgi:hypothetical protein